MQTEVTTQESTLEENKDWAWWLYMAHGVCLVASLGLLCVVPLILNYLKRDDAKGTFVYSHHQWQIRSFWWFLVWIAVSICLFMTVVGIPFAILVWLGAWIWKAYRICRGWIDLGKNRAMPM